MRTDGKKNGQNQFRKIDKIITKITCPVTVEKTEYETKAKCKTRKESFFKCHQILVQDVLSIKYQILKKPLKTKTRKKFQ